MLIRQRSTISIWIYLSIIDEQVLNHLLGRFCIAHRILPPSLNRPFDSGKKKHEFNYRLFYLIFFKKKKKHAKCISRLATDVQTLVHAIYIHKQVI